MQLDVTLKELLTYRTIASFYDTLLGRQTVGGIQTVQRETGALSGAAPLLPIQQWFLAHDLPHPQQWNQYGLLVAPGMTMARLQCLLPRLVAQHDAFNLRFERYPRRMASMLPAAGCAAALPRFGHSRIVAAGRPPGF